MLRLALAGIGIGLLLTGCGGAHSVASPRFRSGGGWQVGSRSLRPCVGVPRGRCEQASGWASTVPYRDCPNCTPPHRTLAALPRGGIVIQLTEAYERGPRVSGGTWPPRIEASAVHAGFEGEPARFSDFQAFFRSGRIQRYLFVWFGRPHPTARQLARANAELLTER